MHELGSPNWFSTMTIDQSAAWVSLLRMGIVLSGYRPLRELATVMYVGNNPMISHQGGTPPELRELHAGGCKIIVIDPRQSETAKLAALHLPLVPGEDVRLLSAMIHVILSENLHDQEFCDRFAIQLDTLRESVAAFTPAVVAQACGLAPEQIVEAARTFATAGPGRVFSATGLCMGPDSNLAHHLASAIDVLCGNFQRAGDPVRNVSALTPYGRFAGVLGPNRTWEQEPRMRSHDIGQMFGEFPSGALADEILHDGEDRIRALIVWGGNPVLAMGQPEKFARALDRLDLLVTLDVRFTDTAARSHYALGTPVQYERTDLSQLRDMTGFNSQTFVQLAPPVVTPPPGVLQEVDFWWGLAQRLGLALEFRKAGYGTDFTQAGGRRALDMTTPPSQEDLARWWCEDALVSYEDLVANPAGVMIDREEQVQDMPDTGARLHLCPDDVRAELAKISPDGSPGDPAFPLKLVVRRKLETMNSAFNRADRTRRRHPANYIFMNGADMAARHLSDLDRVTLRSPYGETSGLVKTDAAVRPGAVSVSHMWTGPDMAFTAALVSLEERIEPINRMPLQTAIPVEVVSTAA
jgi:anaerobic selenocysteine-containing dehydrogenase